MSNFHKSLTKPSEARLGESEMNELARSSKLIQQVGEMNTRFDELHVDESLLNVKEDDEDLPPDPPAHRKHNSPFEAFPDPPEFLLTPLSSYLTPDKSTIEGKKSPPPLITLDEVIPKIPQAKPHENLILRPRIMSMDPKEIAEGGRRSDGTTEGTFQGLKQFLDILPIDYEMKRFYWTLMEHYHRVNYFPLAEMAERGYQEHNYKAPESPQYTGFYNPYPFRSGELEPPPISSLIQGHGKWTPEGTTEDEPGINLESLVKAVWSSRYRYPGRSSSSFSWSFEKTGLTLERVVGEIKNLSEWDRLEDYPDDLPWRWIIGVVSMRTSKTFVLSASMSSLKRKLSELYEKWVNNLEPPKNPLEENCPSYTGHETTWN